MNNVMLDLETMGKGPSAAIVTIGAVFFDPMTGELGAEFEAHIDLRDSARFGEIDPDTVLWWLGQSDEARSQVAAGGAQLAQALNGFATFLTAAGMAPTPSVWGNGASFDCVILRHAYSAALGSDAPWAYRKERDVRTVVDMGRTLLGFDPKRYMPFEGVAHRALDDAKHQARYVSAIYQRMQSRQAAIAVPEGWALVPVEPTRDMREAFHQAHEEWDSGEDWLLDSPDHQWKAMLAVAPTPEGGARDE